MAGLNQKFDSAIANDVIKYREKVARVLESDDGVSVKELRKVDDLNPYRDWFIKLVK